MKDITAELKQMLLNNRDSIACHIYDLELANGAIFHFCEFDKDLNYNGQTYKHNTNIAIPTGTELGAHLTADKMSLTIYTDVSDTIEGAKFLEMARNGGLDKAVMTVSRLYVDDSGEPIGAIRLFTGILEVRSGGGIELKLDIKSKIQMLNVEWPNRRYYPTCPYSLYSTACGVDREKYKVMARVTQVTDSHTFTISVDEPTGYFDNGAIQFLTGKLVGHDATIRSNNGSVITLLISQEAAPAVGDMVKLYPGCDKSYETCKSKFNNGSRNRSTPYVPLKETVI